MSDSHRRTTRWSLLLALTIPLALGCGADKAVAPSLSPESASLSRETGDRGAMADAALFVGNFTFFPDFFPGPGPGNGILRYTGTGAYIDNMVPEGTHGLTIACCMTFGPDENLYVGSPLTSSVLRFNGVTGAYIDTFIPEGRGGLTNPLALVFRGDKLYVGDPGTNAVRRYNARTGAFIDVFVQPGSGGLSGFDPQLMEFGPDGNLYVSGSETRNVLRYNGRTGAFMDEFVPVVGSEANGGGLTFGPDGNLYVSNANGVNRYNGSTGALIDVFVKQGSGGLNGPVGITFGPDGNFYVASSGNELDKGEILRYNKKGRFIDAFVPPGRGDISGPRIIKWKSTTVVCHGQTSITIGYLSAPEYLARGYKLGPCKDGREDGGGGH
jgi:WD40 repeat protein